MDTTQIADQRSGKVAVRRSRAFDNTVPILIVLTLLSGLFWSASASAEKYPWEEYETRVKASQPVSALGPDLLGDQVSLSNGALSFSTTDVSIPGNNALRVALTRTYSLFNRKDYGISDEMLADWAIDLPNISGTFAPEWISGNSSSNRCSDTQAPPMPSSAHFLTEFWNGLHINLPGRGSQELLVILPGASALPVPIDGADYRWTTNDHVNVSCLPSINNGDISGSGSAIGQGFLAITPDGTRYWFDSMAQHYVPVLKSPVAVQGLHITKLTTRRKNVLYATRVEDRFGNWVNYTYANAWNQPGKLSKITASDGRQITVSYGSNGDVASVSDGSRTWQYAYSSTTSGRRSLTQVTRPDNSQWTINFANFTDAEIQNHEVFAPGEIYRRCWMLETPLNYDAQFIASMTHPSGATGTFSASIKEHGRSRVPVSCGNVTTGVPQWGNNPNDDINTFVISYNSLTLDQKTLSGPGLQTATWNYSYAPGISKQFLYGADRDWPVCMDAQCYQPPCTSDSCAGASTTTITGPDNTWTRYTHGNTFKYNEGKLLKVERGSSASNILKSTVNTYDLSQVDQAYSASFGDSINASDQGFSAQYHRPLTQTTITQQGEAFNQQVTSFDAFARPLQVAKWSSAQSYGKTDITVYHDDLDIWVLGQVKSSTIDKTGTSVQVARTDYDATTALPISSYAFGKLQHILSYYPDGTLKTFRDGRNLTTTLSNWYRGVPRNIAYADNTSESATVNATGTIASVSDENGFTTGYAYDSMGRLASITYPTGDTTAWNDTTQSFVQVATSEYGIPAGHWRQTVSTGNGVKINYFDALWRPLLTRTYDVADVAATQHFVQNVYDGNGRAVFSSYPSAASNPVTGIWSSYDALGRVTAVSQDSEYGLLIATTDYLTGFQTRVTNPRGFSSTTSYMAFDAPTTDWPIAVAQPEGAYTDIVRDVFGKPLSITRHNADDSVGLTRSYDFDAHQSLCKRTEPETGATVMGYDAAGNLAWSAAGLAATTACNASISAAVKVERSYDARNRLSALVFPDDNGSQSWSYTADGLPDQITTLNGAGSPATVNSYTYNKRRLPIGEQLSQDNLYAVSIGYGYDVNAHLASHNYPDGSVVAYAPNALGQATQAGNYATAASYYPNGALRQFTYGNGVVHTLTQNARGLPERSRDARGSTVVHDNSLDFDQNGNVLAISDGLAGARSNRDMSYDGLDRLVSAASPMFGNASYSYDVLGNLAAVDIGNRDHSYVYDLSNRLTNVRDVASGTTVVGLGYDVQGNLANKNGVLYDFDFGNRLRDVQGKESYRYDAHGRRIQATDDAGRGIYSFYGRDGVLRYQQDYRKNQSTLYVYLAGSLLAEDFDDALIATAPVLSAPATSTSGDYTVTWNIISGATAYRLDESINGGVWVQRSNGAATSWSANNKPAGEYRYRVRACAIECSGYSLIVTVVVQAPETAPVITLATQDNDGAYSVSWTAVAAATRYRLEERANGGNWTQLQNSTSRSRALSGKADGSYSYRVTACNDVACGPAASKTIQIIHPPASAPTLSAPASDNDGSYVVDWGAVATATSYRVYERIGSGTWTKIYDGASSDTLTRSGKANGSYGYYAEACNAGGCGANSAVRTVQVLHPPASAPTLSAPASDNDGSYVVDWGAVATATSYRVYERIGSGAWTKIYDGSSSDTLTRSGKANGSYSYYAEACNASGCGASSAVRTVQVLHPPGAPSLSVPSSNNNGSYVVDWGAVATATSYRVYERIGSGAWSNIYDGASSATLTRSGKVNGGYGYYAEACNASGCGASSAVRTVQVLHPPGAPSLSVPASNNNGSYVVDWGAVATATSYRVYERIGSGAWSNIYDGSSSATLTRSGKANGGYSYYAEACNASGCGANSAVRTVQVLHPPASAPTLSAPASDNDGSYVVDWGAVATATSYRVYERIGSGTWSKIYDGSSSTNLTRSGKANGSYSYYAEACNAGGCGANSAVRTVVVTFPPNAAPTLTGPTSPTSFTGSYTVTWSAVSGANRYELRERRDSDGWSLIYNAGGTSKARVDRGSAVWGYMVRACNVGGCGPYSAVREVGVRPSGKPGRPNVRGIDFSCDVSWAQSSGATSYDLRRGDTTVYTGANASVHLNAQCGAWAYTARACSAVGCSGWSLPGYNQIGGGGTPQSTAPQGSEQ